MMIVVVSPSARKNWQPLIFWRQLGLSGRAPQYPRPPSHAPASPYCPLAVACLVKVTRLPALRLFFDPSFKFHRAQRFATSRSQDLDCSHLQSLHSIQLLTPRLNHFYRDPSEHSSSFQPQARLLHHFPPWVSEGWTSLIQFCTQKIEAPVSPNDSFHLSAPRNQTRFTTPHLFWTGKRRFLILHRRILALTCACWIWM